MRPVAGSRCSRRRGEPQFTCARLSNSATQVPFGTPGKEALIGRAVANSQPFLFWRRGLVSAMQLCHALVQAEASRTRISPARAKVGLPNVFDSVQTRLGLCVPRHRHKHKCHRQDFYCLALLSSHRPSYATTLQSLPAFQPGSSDLRHLRDVCVIATALLRVRVDAGSVLLGTHRHMYGESSNSTWLIAYGHA